MLQECETKMILSWSGVSVMNSLWRGGMGDDKIEEVVIRPDSWTKDSHTSTWLCQTSLLTPSDATMGGRWLARSPTSSLMILLRSLRLMRWTCSGCILP